MGGDHRTAIGGRYTYTATVLSDFTPGSSSVLRAGDQLLGEGENVEVEPPRPLV